MATVFWCLLSIFAVDEDRTEYETVEINCQMAHDVLYVKAGQRIFEFDKMKDVERFKNLKSAYLKKEKNIWNSLVKTTILIEKPIDE